MVIKKLKQLIKDLEKKNKTTDVLSFPFYEKREINNFFKKKIPFYLGDIIINLDKIIDQTRDRKDIRIQFDKLWIHGLAHLLGYRHKFDKDYKKMKIIEKKFFNLVN